MNQNPLISIFIPVYNGEEYLVETLNSIKNQSYTNFEVLLVDDTSTDKSFEIINDFANTDKRFKVFQKENGGMTAPSWNFIIPKIQGEFIFYSSQDDLFSNNLLEQMIERQQETDADTILPDMEFYFKNKTNNDKIIGLNGNKEIILSGKEACAASLKWSIHGFMLNKKSLIEKQHFPENAFDSDEFVTRKILFESNKVAFSNGIFYYRQDNENAITKSFSAKNFFRLNTLIRLFYFLTDNNFDNRNKTETLFDLYRKYLKYNAIHHLYKYQNTTDARNIERFLYVFKKDYLEDSELISNIKYSNSILNIKLIIIYFIFKFSVFYTIALLIEILRTKYLYSRLKIYGI